MADQPAITEQARRSRGVINTGNTLNREPSQWALVSVDAVFDGSDAQRRNVFEMALQDIAKLGRVRDAAQDIADHYRRSINVGPGQHVTRETALWLALNRALGAKE